MELVILIGLPGSGKTTFYQARYAPTHAHVSKDRFPHNRDRSQRQQTLLREAFAAGQSVVLDNTNPTRAARAGAIAVAREYGARVIGYVFDVPAKICRQRNAARVGRQRVPEVAIWTVRKRLEFPTAEEGFDELYVVRPAEDGRFQVSAVGPSEIPEPHKS